MNESDTLKNDHQVLHQLLDYAITTELKNNEENSNRFITSSDKESECLPPKICHEFQTARLFLSHFGYLNNNDSLAQNELGTFGGLIALDPKIPGFAADLENLDHISARTCDTVHIFYVKSGQTTPEAILANVVSTNYIIIGSKSIKN